MSETNVTSVSSGQEQELLRFAALELARAQADRDAAIARMAYWGQFIGKVGRREGVGLYIAGDAPDLRAYQPRPSPGRE
jgi:hypothetical protein